MKISRALLAPAGGFAILLTVAWSQAGEDYCIIEGPDIITYKVADSFGSFDFAYYGQNDGIGGFAMASTSGNPGDMIAQWAYSGDGTKSPVIAQNIYRLCDGRFEQVGMSWLKHSFCAVSEAMCNCQNTSCSTLGIGCADTYWAGLNADADGPRSEINATTGVYEYPFFQSPCGQSSLRGKLQIHEDDRDPALNAGCHYYIEVQYVAPDSDPEWGEDEYDYDNQFNNVSYRPINFDSSTSTSPVNSDDPAQVGDSTIVMKSAIQAWAFESNATVIEVWTPEADGDVGLMHVGYKASDNGDGTWHYEFVVHNQNSHRSGGYFRVPIADCVEITNIDFNDVDYHSCEMVENTDWDFEVADGYVTWHTEAYETNEWANAIRWATAYTFRFDANYPPSTGNALLGMWRPGDGDELEVAIRGPLPDCVDCTGDIDGDGTVGVNDVLALIAAWGGAGGDVDGDGNTDVNDLLLLLDHYGETC